MDVVRKLGDIFDTRQKRQLVVLFLMILIGGVFETLGVSMMVPVVGAMTTPEEIYRIVDEHAPLAAFVDSTGLRDSTRMILFLIFSLIGIYIIKNIYLLFQVYRQNTFVTRSRNEMISRVLMEFLNRPYEDYLEADIPTAFRLTDSDIPKTFSLLLAALSLCTELVVSFFMCIVMICVNWKMTILIIAVFLLMTLVNTRFIKPRIEKLGKQDLKISSRIAKWRIEAIYGLKDVKVLNRQEFFVRNYYESGKKGADTARNYAVLSNTPRFLIETVFVVSVLSFIAAYILRGGDIKLLFTQLTVFAAAALRVMPSANRINTYITEIAFEKPSLDYLHENLTGRAKKLDNFRAERLERGDYAAPEYSSDDGGFTDSIELKGICFRYPGTDRDIFTDAYMTVRKGTSVGIMGATGAGKSTIVDILLGLLHVQKGEILCDGTSVFDDYDRWLSRIGYIPQTIYLVDESIRDNIAFGIDADRISDERIWEVLEEAQLAEFVRTLPEGLDTKIGDRGVRLSGGQRQRIGIARALYHDPEILVFDEATSALDNDTERALMDAINGFHGKKTMVIIAHRLNTIAGCDVIYEVKDAKLFPTTLKGKEILT